jgi:hypothetical protein
MSDLTALTEQATRLSVDFAPSARPAPAISCRRPLKSETLMVHRSHRQLVSCSEYRGQITVHPGKRGPGALVVPKQRLLRLATNLLGEFFLWPTPCKGKAATLCDSVIKAAENSWVRVAWDSGIGGYAFEAVATDFRPEWPAVGFDEVLAAAFPATYEQYLREVC